MSVWKAVELRKYFSVELKNERPMFLFYKIFLFLNTFSDLLTEQTFCIYQNANIDLMLFIHKEKIWKCVKFSHKWGIDIPFKQFLGERFLEAIGLKYLYWTRKIRSCSDFHFENPHTIFINVTNII